MGLDILSVEETEIKDMAVALLYPCAIMTYKRRSVLLTTITKYMDFPFTWVCNFFLSELSFKCIKIYSELQMA